MNHLPYIAGAYGLALALAFWFGVTAWTRTARAKRRLAALDRRGLDRRGRA
jgi:hypothetical protein